MDIPQPKSVPGVQLIATAEIAAQQLFETEVYKLCTHLLKPISYSVGL